MGSSMFRPDLYPDVVQSIPFLLELFPSNRLTRSEKTTLIDDKCTNIRNEGSEKVRGGVNANAGSVQTVWSVVKDLFSKEEGKERWPGIILSSYKNEQSRDVRIRRMFAFLAFCVIKRYPSDHYPPVQMRTIKISVDYHQTAFRKTKGRHTYPTKLRAR
ncbi:MAG: hypothetical protein ACLVEJ_04880 [Parabacteroides sp.]